MKDWIAALDDVSWPTEGMLDSINSVEVCGFLLYYIFAIILFFKHVSRGYDYVFLARNTPTIHSTEYESDKQIQME